MAKLLDRKEILKKNREKELAEEERQIELDLVKEIQTRIAQEKQEVKEKRQAEWQEGVNKMKKKAKKLSLLFVKANKKLLKTVVGGYGKIEKKAETLGESIIKLNKIILNFFFKYQYFFIGLLLLTLFSLNVKDLVLRFYGRRFESSIRKINFYPNLMKQKLAISRLAFENGYQDLTNDFWALSEDEFGFWKKAGMGIVWEKSFKETKDYLNIVEKKKTLLKKIIEKEALIPYSWQMKLKRAEIETELMTKEPALKSLDGAYWLYPGLDEKYRKRLSQ